MKIAMVVTGGVHPSGSRELGDLGDVDRALRQRVRWRAAGRI